MSTGIDTMSCFSGLLRILYKPGSRSSSSAARSKRDIMSSNGLSSLRNLSLSGPIIFCVVSRNSAVIYDWFTVDPNGSELTRACVDHEIEDRIDCGPILLDDYGLGNIPNGHG